MQYRVQHVIINMDKIHMIYNYAKTSDIKTQSIRKDRVFVVSRAKLNVLMHSIQHLLIYNKCNHMLNIADLNIYLYQKKTHLIKCFGCWLHARISKHNHVCQISLDCFETTW